MATWTADQRRAIEAGEGNLVVAAAAGSGKTAVLVERICRLILEEGADVERMLIATFTRAAAAEMKERIVHRLQEEAAKGHPQSRRLQQQLNRIDRAPIGTLHSFCGTLLRQYYHLIGLEPSFRTEEESVTQSIFDEVLADVVDDCFERNEPDFIALADCWGGQDGAEIGELIRRVYGQIRNSPDSLEWLRAQAEAFRFARLEDTAWYPELVGQVLSALALAETLLEAALTDCRQPGGPAGYAPQLTQEREAVAALRAACEAGQLPEAGALEALFGRLPPARGVDDARKTFTQNLRKKAKDVLGKVAKGPLLLDRATMEDRTRAVYPQMAALHKAVAEFDGAYTQEKRRENILDFPDLEHLALQVLGDAGARQEVLATYDYVFVDEYQDISPIQDALLRAVARPGRFFCVGDVKQSIYRFRAAEPAIFIDRLERAKDGRTPGEQRIDLAMNFRSAPQVVDLVNFFFDALMSRRLGDVDYTGSHRLVNGAKAPPEPGPGNALILIDNAGQSDAELTRLQELIALEREAAVIAGHIQAMVGRMIWDGKAGETGIYRPARYGDIVILMRSVSGVAGLYTDVLRRSGIPAAAESEGGFAEQLEIELLMACLRLIDNTLRDNDMIACLNSVIGGMELSELVELRGAYREGSFAEAVLRYAAEQDNGTAGRLLAFLRRLEDWRALARHNDLEKLIWRVCDDTALMDYVGTLPGGDGRQANLRQAAALGRAFRGGLYDFIQRFERISAGSRRAAGGTGGGDAVRILTVHKSKGLEFPIVILANLSKQINQMDARQNLMLHGELGLGPRYADPKHRTRANTFARLAIQERIRRENLSEEMRLLYVALTRARERLILVATVDDLAKQLPKWALPPLPELLADGAKSWLDWLGPMALRTAAGQALAEREEAAGDWQGELLDISIVPADEIERRYLAEGNRKERVEALLTSLEAVEPPEELVRDLNWQYPWGDVAALPSKVSATSLLDSRRNWRGPLPAPEIRRQPLFLEQTGRYSAAELGTFVHTVLQLLPVGAEPADVPAHLADFEARGLIPEGVAKLVNLEWIDRYLTSDLYRRMCASPRVDRELPFNLAMPAGVVFPKETSDESILVQGIIDCCFLEGDRWVLVDYKTNRVDGAHTVEYHAQYYRRQLEVYRQALTEITGAEVSSAWLFLLSVGQAVQVL